MRRDPAVPSPAQRARVVLRFRAPDVSLRFDRRVLLAFVAAGFVALLAVVGTLVIGQVSVPLGQLLAALLGHARPADQLVITTLRLPRVLVALFVGASLGMSGAIFQGIAQNPLVAPDIIGVNSGAALAVVGAVVIGGSGQPPGLFAFGGAMLAAIVVYALSIRSGLSRFRLVLIGIGVNAVLAAAITYLLTQASLNQVAELNRYLLGDVSAATWPTVTGLVIPAVVLMAIGAALVPRMQVLQLGDATAAGLGAHLARSRLLLLVVGVGLAAVAVTAAGPVGFVAFIAPHIARRMARSTGADILPVAAAAGGALVVVADYASQRLLEPTQLPVGILTVVIGGPYFMWLLIRQSRADLIA